MWHGIDCNKCRWKNKCNNDCVGFEPKIEQNNEEWFVNLSTKEKAEVIYDFVEFCLNYERYPNKEKYKLLMGSLDDIVKWLKEKKIDIK